MTEVKKINKKKKINKNLHNQLTLLSFYLLEKQI